MSVTSSRAGAIRSLNANDRWWRCHRFFFFPFTDWLCRPPFWESKHPTNTQHTSTLLCGLTMVHTCVVAGCRNRRTPGTTLSFYRFPRDPERKQRWIAAVNREGWVPNDGSRLCSTHFISGMNAVQLTAARSATHLVFIQHTFLMQAFQREIYFI